MLENPFAKNLRGYPRRKEDKLILDNNTIQIDDSKSVFFNKITLDKRIDDYEYEKKYMKFVKEMKLHIGNFVDFEPELRKKKRIIKENNFLNKIGFNCVLPRKTMKITFTSNSNKTTENNINLNLNKFLSMHNDLENQNSFKIKNPIIPLLNNNKIQNTYQKEINTSNFNQLRTISKDGERVNTNLNYNENSENEKIILQKKSSSNIKNLCNLKSFKELIGKSDLPEYQISNNSNNNINKISNGFTARKFLNQKFSFKSINARKSSDFFITNNNNLNLKDNFSKTQNNFGIKNDNNKITNFFDSTQNSNFYKLNQKNFENSLTNRKRPESNRTHYELGIKNNYFKRDFIEKNKNISDKKYYFSKKDNLKINIEKENFGIQNQNLSNKNISTKSINLKILTSKNNNDHSNFSEINVSKGTKLRANLKTKESTSDNLDHDKNKTTKNVHITENIQSKFITIDEGKNSNFNVNSTLNKFSTIKTPKVNEKIEFSQTSKYKKFKELKSLRKTNNDSNLESSEINNSIYATPKPKRNFSAKEIYDKLSDRKGQFNKEIRTISFHNSSIVKDANTKWYNPLKKVKRKFLMREATDDRIEDREDIVLPKHDKRDKDFIKSPDDGYADKKIYFIEKNKANMINHINTISRMTDENYIKYGNFLENKYDFYSHQVDIPEYIFDSKRYRPKTNTKDIDRRTSNIRIIYENILKVKSRIFNVNLKRKEN